MHQSESLLQKIIPANDSDIQTFFLCKILSNLLEELRNTLNISSSVCPLSGLVLGLSQNDNLFGIGGGINYGNNWSSMFFLFPAELIGGSEEISDASEIILLISATG
jgi:hypothetical protein